MAPPPPAPRGGAEFVATDCGTLEVAEPAREPVDPERTSLQSIRPIPKISAPESAPRRLKRSFTAPTQRTRRHLKTRLAALLPLLLLSCADNELQPPGSVTPQLLAVEAPARVVAGFGQPYELRATAELPDAAPGRFAVLAAVSGPGLADPLTWRLADDGSAAPLADPGAGQLALSGDNVPGDGVFTAAIAADFAGELGDFQLALRLLDGGSPVDSGQASIARVANSPPALSRLAAPDTLASGATLELSAVAVDPDGADDLVGVQLETVGGAVRSWSLQPANDSLWTLSAGPVLAAGFAGATPFRLVASDRAGQTAELPLEIVLENAPPVLDAAGFALWIYDFGTESWLPHAVGDTLRLDVPAADLAIYNLSLPVADEQTAVDVAAVEWAIERAGTPDGEFDWNAMDDFGPELSEFDFVAGDGVWSGGFQLPAGITHPDWVLRIRAFDLTGQPALPVEWPLRLTAPAGAPGTPAEPRAVDAAARARLAARGAGGAR